MTFFRSRGTLLAKTALAAVLIIGQFVEAGEPSRSITDSNPQNALRPPGGSFSLTDHLGRPVTDHSFRGKYLLAYFGYTFCPDVCPTDLSIMTSALDMLKGDGEDIQPVFITIDPARDTIQKLANYVAHFHPRLIGLTGSQQQIRKAASAFKVGYYRVDPPKHLKLPKNTYLMAHSAVTYLMGPDGRFIRTFDHQTDPESMAAAIRGYISTGSY